VTTAAGCSAWAGVDDLPTQVVELYDADTWCGWLGLATDILWSATGRRWRGAGATTTASLRAAPPRLGEAADRAPSGRCDCWVAAPIGIPVLQRSHYEPASVRLPHPDATAVTSITMDGAAFAGSWRLDGAWLVRTDGLGWPTCGDRTQVAYTYGIDPPRGGRMACAELAAELGKAACPDCDLECRLPARVRSVSRQGISFDVVDPQEYLEKGFTGLTGVDMWITAMNPRRRPERGRVWSPDIKRARRIS
jgi:hypothetical protein